MQAEGNPNAAQVVLPGSPVPTSMGVAQLTDVGGREWVALEVRTPVGISVYFLDPTDAVAAGEALAQAGKASAAGVLLVGRG